MDRLPSNNALAAFRAVIFDLDGVVVDSEPFHERAFLEVFGEMGYRETHGIDFASYYGRSDQALWLDFIEKHRPIQTLAELVERKQDRLLEMLRREKPIFAGLPHLVQRLADRYQLAIASGSAHKVIDTVLEMKGLARYFPIRVSADDVAQGKPQPDVFLRAAQLLKTDPKDICVIEDASAGVEAARAAQMTVIAITNSLPAEKLREATRVVTTYVEIERLLL